MARPPNPDTRALRIAEDLSLPLDAAVQTFAVLAKRGAGKTYTTLVIVEEMLKAGLQVVLADPVGVTWGLRASADGKGPGLPIVVLGGDHGDLPLDVASGQLIADLVVDERLSVVLDLSRFRKGEQVRFMTDFAEQLYHRNRNPLHLVLDEADAFAPQRPQKGQERMLGAVEDLVRRGRARGLGVSLVTQRSAVLNKDVLTQVEVLVALRTIAPQDRAAIDEWIKVHGTPEQREQLMSSLPSLPIGTAWFWSPGWLNIFQRVKVRPRETFDSSATPEVGKRIQAPKRLADVDLEQLRGRLASTIERAKADDPKALRARIAELERRVQSEHASGPAQAATAAVVAERDVLRQRVSELEGTVRLMEAGRDRRIAYLSMLRTDITRLAERLPELDAIVGDEASIAVAHPRDASSAARANAMPRELPRQPVARIERNLTPSPERLDGDDRLSGPQQRILDALATLEAAGDAVPQRANVAVFADQSPSSSGFANNLSALRTRGLIEYPIKGRLRLTEQGRQIASVSEPISSVSQLHEAWRQRLSGPMWRILQALIAAYPNPRPREEVAERAGQSATSSGYANNLSALRTLGLLDYPSKGEVVATELLFPAALV